MYCVQCRWVMSNRVRICLCGIYIDQSDLPFFKGFCTLMPLKMWSRFLWWGNVTLKIKSFKVVFLEEAPLKSFGKYLQLEHWTLNSRFVWSYLIFSATYTYWKKQNQNYTHKNPWTLKFLRNHWAWENSVYYWRTIYLVQVNIRTRCETCLKLTIKTPEQRLSLFWCLYC